MKPKEVSKSELKAKMFEYFRELESGKEPLIVTDYGKPTLIIYPYKKALGPEEGFAVLRQKALEISEEAMLRSTSDEWDALK